MTNFEFEFYEIEKVETNEKANNAVTERLRRLYFADNALESKKDRYIDHYFEVETDASVASFYGFDIHGTNRKQVKIKKLNKAINQFKDSSVGIDDAGISLGDLGEDCD